MMETKSRCSAAHSMMKAKPGSRCSLEDGDEADDEDEAYVPLFKPVSQVNVSPDPSGIQTIS